MFLCFPDNWWSQVSPRYFLRLVDLYKGAVVYLLSGRKTLLIPVLFSSYITAALKLLEKLHKVRGKPGCVLAQDGSVLAAFCRVTVMITALICELCHCPPRHHMGKMLVVFLNSRRLVPSQTLGKIYPKECC